MTKREIREKYGINGRAIEATRVFRREMDFNHTTIEAQTIIAVRGNEYAHLNTYNGNLGRNFEPKWFPLKADWDLSNPKGELKKKLRGYKELPATEWPDVVVAVGKSVELHAV